MTTRIAALFVTALVGVLVVIGLMLAPLGWPALAPYLLVVVTGMALLVRRARALRAPAHADGRTCACCTGTVFDPVEIR
jgi:hypothetical protein